MTDPTRTELPEELADDARALVRALAAVAGEEGRVLDLIEERHAELGADETHRLLSAAIVVTFSECFDGPVSLDEHALTPTPNAFRCSSDPMTAAAGATSARRCASSAMTHACWRG